MVRRIAAAAPPILVLLATLAFIVAEALGGAPLSLGRVRNIAEAAGLGSAAEVMRLLDEGQDPTQVMPLRAEIISSSVRQASAVEAAVWSRRVELFKFIDERWPIAASERARLACLARDLDAAEVGDYLGADQQACVAGAVLNGIQHRSPAPAQLR